MQYGKKIWYLRFNYAIGDCIFSKDQLQKYLSIKVAEYLEKHVGKVIFGI